MEATSSLNSWNATARVGGTLPGTGHQCAVLASQPFEHLLLHVAPAAYADQQEGEAPKCHPGTRVTVIQEIADWILSITFKLQWILWMRGQAGTGKSAIARSIVERCLQEGKVVIARFFFFRSDSTRNTLSPVVPTLAFQLMRAIPPLEPIIMAEMQKNPLIFKESLEAQFQALIVKPLTLVYHDDPTLPIIAILFDGVDECGGDETRAGEIAQTDLIKTIFDLFRDCQIPVRIMFASRPEVQIKTTFATRAITEVTHVLVLDQRYKADDDIRLFLGDEFTKIKETHILRNLLPPEWPEPEHVEEIVGKSSGHFIYPSVISKFISHQRRNPATQLEIVRGLIPTGNQSPFAQLDALYRHIFTQVEDNETANTILALQLTTGANTVMECSDFLEISEDTIHIALSNLSSLVDISDQGDISFSHASLGDFLTDRSRSQEFYINTTEWKNHKLFKIWAHKKNYPRYFGGVGLDFENEENQQILREMDPLWLAESIRKRWHGQDSHDIWLDHLNDVRWFNFNDGGAIYQHQLYITARAIRNHDLWSSENAGEIQKHHDFSVAIARLDHEERGISGQEAHTDSLPAPATAVSSSVTVMEDTPGEVKRPQSLFKSAFRSMAGRFKKKGHR